MESLDKTHFRECGVVDLTGDDLPMSTDPAGGSDATNHNTPQGRSSLDTPLLEPIGVNLTVDMVDMTFTDSEGEGDGNEPHRRHLPEGSFLANALDNSEDKPMESCKSNQVNGIESKAEGKGKKFWKKKPENKNGSHQKGSNKDSVPNSKSAAAARPKKRKKCSKPLPMDRAGPSHRVAMQSTIEKPAREGGNAKKKRAKKRKKGKQNEGKSAKIFTAAPRGKVATLTENSNRCTKANTDNTDGASPNIKGKKKVVRTVSTEGKTQRPHRKRGRGEKGNQQRHDNSNSSSFPPYAGQHFSSKAGVSEAIIHVDVLPMNFDDYVLSSFFRRRGFLNAYVARESQRLIGFIKFDCTANAIAAMESVRQQRFWWAHHMALSGNSSTADYERQRRFWRPPQCPPGKYGSMVGLDGRSPSSRSPPRPPRLPGEPSGMAIRDRRPGNELGTICSPQKRQASYRADQREKVAVLDARQNDEPITTDDMDEFGRTVQAKDNIRSETKRRHGSPLVQQAPDRQQKSNVKASDCKNKRAKPIMAEKGSLGDNPDQIRSGHARTSESELFEPIVGTTGRNPLEGNKKNTTVRNGADAIMQSKLNKVKFNEHALKDDSTATNEIYLYQASAEQLIESKSDSKAQKDCASVTGGRQPEQGHGKGVVSVKHAETTLGDRKNAATINSSLSFNAKRYTEIFPSGAPPTKVTEPELVDHQGATAAAISDKKESGPCLPQFTSESKASISVVDDDAGSEKRKSTDVLHERGSHSHGLGYKEHGSHLISQRTNDESIGETGEALPSIATKDGLLCSQDKAGSSPNSGTSDGDSKTQVFNGDDTFDVLAPRPGNADEKPDGELLAISGETSHRAQSSRASKATAGATNPTKNGVSITERSELPHEKAPIIIDCSYNERKDGSGCSEPVETTATKVPSRVPLSQSGTHVAEAVKTKSLSTTTLEANKLNRVVENEETKSKTDCTDGAYTFHNRKAHSEKLKVRSTGTNAISDGKNSLKVGTDKSKEKKLSGVSHEKAPETIVIDSSDDETTGEPVMSSAPTSQPPQSVASKPLRSFCSEPKRFKPKPTAKRRKRSNSSGSSKEGFPAKEPERRVPEVNFVFSQYKFQPELDYDYQKSQSAALQEQERLFREARARVQAQTLFQRRPTAFTSPMVNIRKLSTEYPNHWKLRDPYARLGLPPGCSIALVKKQYRRLALVYHPDKSKLVDAPTRFQAITEAYKQLTRT